MFEVSIKKMFSAAHRLTEIGGSCEKLHGHNFMVEVSVASEELTKEGLLIDFRELKSWLNEILEIIDHKCLNEISAFDGLNPSSENIAKFIYDRLYEKINQKNLSVTRVTVWESEKASVTYS